MIIILCDIVYTPYTRLTGLSGISKLAIGQYLPRTTQSETGQLFWAWSVDQVCFKLARNVLLPMTNDSSITSQGNTGQKNYELIIFS